MVEVRNMKGALLAVLAAIHVVGQVPVLSPDAEFELDAALKPHHKPTGRSYFAATRGGLSFIHIDENFISFNSADLDGRPLYATTRLASVHAFIYTALFRQDGSVWIVSSGPASFSEFSAIGSLGSAAPEHASTGQLFQHLAPYNDFDLYNPTGKHLDSVRLLRPAAGGTENAVAAGGDELVLLGSYGPPGLSSNRSQSVRFGTVMNGEFKERTVIRLSPPIRGFIPILVPNGNLLLINKTSGGMEVLDPSAKSGVYIHLSEPHPVRAAAFDAGYLYLLSGPVVLKTDLSGHLLSTFQFQLTSGFDPMLIGVTGAALYLVDKSGRAERFRLTL